MSVVCFDKALLGSIKEVISFSLFFHENKKTKKQKTKNQILYFVRRPELPCFVFAPPIDLKGLSRCNLKLKTAKETYLQLLQLHGILDNGIDRLMRSNLSRMTSPKLVFKKCALTLIIISRFWNQFDPIERIPLIDI